MTGSDLGLLFARPVRDFFRLSLIGSHLRISKMGSFGNFHFLNAERRRHAGGNASREEAGGKAATPAMARSMHDGWCFSHSLISLSLLVTFQIMASFKGLN
jgi:hypothetical protein